jgi:hypothetical protein
MLFSEQKGVERMMVALVSLSIKVARCAAEALRSWIRGMVGRMTEDGGNGQLGIPDELREIESWLDAEGLSRPFPISESLCWSLMHPNTLASLTVEDREEIVLVAEFCASYFYCLGCDVWAADLIGSK